MGVNVATLWSVLFLAVACLIVAAALHGARTEAFA
jgi:hypothetical protein